LLAGGIGTVGGSMRSMMFSKKQNVDEKEISETVPDESNGREVAESETMI
jgi:hypothetical protein